MYTDISIVTECYSCEPDNKNLCVTSTSTTPSHKSVDHLGLQCAAAITQEKTPKLFEGRESVV